MRFTRITIIKERVPDKPDINDELQWFGGSLGLFSLRDKDKSRFRVFIVLVNATAGAAAVREGAIRAARSLGASNAQVLFRVVIPEAVPYIVTGWQIALGNAFMAIVAAEMLAAHSGLGFMIWDAQIYSQIDRMFVAFIALCLMGFMTDRLGHALARRFFGHYRVV